MDLGRKGRRPGEPLPRRGEEGGKERAGADERALFSIAPPPSACEREGGVLLPPPPLGKAERRRSRTPEPGAAELGFDDGEFGEFV